MSMSMPIHSIKPDPSQGMNEAAEIPNQNQIAGLFPKYPAIPGQVLAFYPGPTVSLPVFVPNEVLLDPTKLSGFESRATGKRDEVMSTADFLSKIGAVVVVQGLAAAENNEMKLKPNTFSAYFKPSAGTKNQLQELLDSSMNNIVPFGKKLTELPGEIGNVMRQAWEKGPAVAAMVAAVLFEVAKRGVFGAKNEGSSNTDSSA